MTAVAAHPHRRSVLADLLPGSRLRDLTLILAGALFTAGASQIRIPLGFTPVPINGLTFAALLVGAGLGLRRGVLAVGLFWALGAIGLPFYVGASGGWDHATGATGGYLIGAIAAAAFVGFVAERGGDKRFLTSVPAMMLANAVLIWVPGVLWLAHQQDVGVLTGDPSAFELGLRPFIGGDIAKMVAAGLLLPATWRVTARR